MKNILIVVLTLGFSGVGAQETTISDVTNRLGKTRSAKAIPKGTLLTNVNYMYNTYSNSYIELKQHSPSVRIGYGVTKRLDFRMETGYSFENSNWANNWGYLPSSKTNTWTGFKVGSKFNLFQENRWVPQLAISIDYVLVSIGYENIFDQSDYRTGVALSLPWSYNLSKKFRLGGGFEYMYFGESYFSEVYKGSLNGRYEFLKGLGIFMELMIPTDLDKYSLVPSAGAYYRITKNIQVDVSFGKYIGDYGASSYTNKNQFSGGFSWLLFN
tara:strand:+ start:19059 stop:19868 length:810 start_codon:yes stop_codon:yes gene_type:complete